MLYPSLPGQSNIYVASAGLFAFARLAKEMLAVKDTVGLYDPP